MRTFDANMDDPRLIEIMVRCTKYWQTPQKVKLITIQETLLGDDTKLTKYSQDLFILFLVNFWIAGRHDIL